jgi:6-phospho-3-hexuloisomerase
MKYMTTSPELLNRLTTSAATGSTLSASESLGAIVNETTGLLAAITTGESAKSLNAAASVLNNADRVFVLGAGRSGLALRMTAMRLMHLGLTVHIVGDDTTPAIRGGDALLVASGSGTTANIVAAATTSADLGADIVAITTAPDSALAKMATVVIEIPAAQKLVRDGARSIQYAGGLFEQAVVFVGDALFHSLWLASGQTADEIWPRHANIE